MILQGPSSHQGTAKPGTNPQVQRSSLTDRLRALVDRLTRDMIQE